MPGTFSQLYIQYVFAVKGRENLIRPAFENEVYKYIAGIIYGKEQKPLAVNGMPDHIHVLVGLKPAMRISDLIRDIKNNSCNFINEKGWLKQKFSWQEGYGVFSYSESNYGKVIAKIKSCIIRKEISGRSTSYCLKSLIFRLRKNICSNFMNKSYVTPSGL